MQRTLILIFFLSGTAALVFETLWFRLTGLALGNSVWSATIVLAAFMGGLSLGNALVARRYHRIAHPIRLYAGLELAIGVGGFAVVAVLPGLAAILGPLLADFVDTPWLLNTVRLGVAFSLLLVPATAMGCTLPVITGALSEADPNFGASFGRLYGWNTLGATLGAIGAEAVLVRWLGIAGAGLVAVALNLGAALLALRVAGAYPATPKIETPPARGRFSARTYRYLLVGALSGAAMLALEVVWFRFLLLTYTGTGLVFATMLTVVLAGIGIGGLAAARLARNDEQHCRWLPHVTALCGALVVLTYYGFDLFTVPQIKQHPSFVEFVGFAVFLMLPVALLSGAAFTMVARAVKEEVGASIRTAGIAALWNTVGAMVGSFCGGFVLLPLAGMERSFFILAAVYCATALLVPRSAAVAKPLAYSARATLAVAVACLVIFPFGLMERSFFRIVERTLQDYTLVATREAITETIRYYRRDVFGAPHFYRLVTDSYSMSGTSTIAQRYMKLYVYLPVALHTEARDALLISFGVGSTAKALTDTHSLRHIDVVDISRDILEMSSIIYPGDDNPLRDERVRTHIEDGRFFLNASERRYDLITSEPPPPKVAGVVNLYSQEYFESIRAHLTPGGYASYWLPVYQLKPVETLAIIKGFCNAFEDCTLWSGVGLEWMLMGSNGADRAVPIDEFSAQWRDPRVASELAALGFEQPEQMGSLFLADAGQLAELTGHVSPLVDNYPARLSSELVDAVRVPFYAQLLDEQGRRARFARSEFIARVWPPELVERTPPYFHYDRMIGDYFADHVYQDWHQPFLWEAIDDVLANTRLETLPLWLLGTDVAAQRNALELEAGETTPADVDLELALGRLAQRDYRGALLHMRRSLRTEPLTVGTFSLLLYLLAKSGELDEARSLVSQVRGSQGPEIDAYVAWFETKFPVRMSSLDSYAK